MGPVKVLFGQFLVHLEEAGDDVGFGGVFGEAVGFEDIVVVGADEYLRGRMTCLGRKKK